MFQNTSMTGVGLLAMLLVYGLQWLGIVVPQDEVAAIIVKAVEVVSWVLAIVGQVRRKDLRMGLARR